MSASAACAVPVYQVLTPAQGDVLSAIATHQWFHDRPPTLRELAVTLQCSLANVKRHLARLYLRGLVTWRDCKSRTLRLTGAPWVVVADKPSVVERCRFCGRDVRTCSGFECGGKDVR